MGCWPILAWTCIQSVGWQLELCISNVAADVSHRRRFRFLRCAATVADSQGVLPLGAVAAANGAARRCSQPGEMLPKDVNGTRSSILRGEFFH